MNFFRGLFKDFPAPAQLVFLLMFVVVGSVAGTLLAFVLAAGFNPASIQEFSQSLTTNAALAREAQFISQLFTFVIPPLVCAWIFSENAADYLALRRPKNFGAIAWAALSVLFMLPVLNFAYELNMQLQLPESLKFIENKIQAMEEAANRAIDLILNTDSMAVFAVNVFIVAVFAAFGEELLFRGALQTIFGKMIGNHHAVIWIVAAIFSAIHLQFYGFLPRLLLGAWLGYLLFYTRSLWVPIIAHFFNNFAAIAQNQYFKDDAAALDRLNSIGTSDTWWLSAASAALFIFAAQKIVKKS
ncbi:MAG: CPBP family intramembrane metalloprotease [Dysgonamonadaceae bacterium]|jgi:membrane protease YdiL (CAAX protease family)|nr:CPBP family intramembrane metalloprotease [Dysgonamonadaceae bacterium]